MGTQVVVQPQRGDKPRALDLLVMENVFYDRNLHPVYDLKGSTRARYVPDDPTRADIVLLDENLLESSIASPILVTPPPLSDQEAAGYKPEERGVGGYLRSLGFL